MITKPGKILVIDDDRDILLTTRVVLKKQFGLIKTEADPEMILQLLDNELFDIILLDMNFSAGDTSGKEGMKWLREIRKKDESAHVIMMTAYGDIDLAVKAMKEGAADFIVKPWPLSSMHTASANPRERSLNYAENRNFCIRTWTRNS